MTNVSTWFKVRARGAELLVTGQSATGAGGILELRGTSFTALGLDGTSREENFTRY
jgi:hypothetical protein